MTSAVKKGALSALLVAAAAFGAAQAISVTVDGNPVQFANVGPQYVNGRVLVPLRGVFEEMGAYVDWNASTRTVMASRGDTDVRLRIGDREAMVNGRRELLDVPAQIFRGSTMVPLRFISEALGADVQWADARREVMINTLATGTIRNDRLDRRSGLRRATVARLEANTVIPVTLDSTLSSRDSRKGDRFTATVRTDSDNDTYAGLPAGTKIEGVVTTARPKKGNDPGLIDMEFRRIRLPDGTARQIDGSLTSLDAERVTRNSNGVMTARTGQRDDRMVYAGYGAAGGLLVGLLTKRPLEGAILGGVLGYLYGQVQKDQRASDVTLRPGTEFGVRLDQAVTIRER
jgi:hypothetical protein